VKPWQLDRWQGSQTPTQAEFDDLLKVTVTYPLVMTNVAIEAMAIEIVDLPSYKMVDLSIVMLVYQRVDCAKCMKTPPAAVETCNMLEKGLIVTT